MHYILQVLLIFVVGTLLLRIAGRKSVSQMTMPQTVIMLSLGTLLIQPVAGHGLWTTFAIALLLILCLVATEWLGMKSDNTETVVSGKSKAVIVDGNL